MERKVHIGALSVDLVLFYEPVMIPVQIPHEVLSAATTLGLEIYNELGELRTLTEVVKIKWTGNPPRPVVRVILNLGGENNKMVFEAGVVDDGWVTNVKTHAVNMALDVDMLYAGKLERLTEHLATLPKPRK
jgi:hypothetical protein